MCYTESRYSACRLISPPLSLNTALSSPDNEHDDVPDDRRDTHVCLVHDTHKVMTGDAGDCERVSTRGRIECETGSQDTRGERRAQRLQIACRESGVRSNQGSCIPFFAVTSHFCKRCTLSSLVVIRAAGFRDVASVDFLPLVQVLVFHCREMNRFSRFPPRAKSCVCSRPAQVTAH